MIRWEYKQLRWRGTEQQVDGDVEVAIHGNSFSWLSILQGDARNVDPFTLRPTIIPYGQDISIYTDEDRNSWTSLPCGRKLLCWGKSEEEGGL